MTRRLAYIGLAGLLGLLILATLCAAFVPSYSQRLMTGWAP